MTRKKLSIGILGAGITGLSTAYELDKQGLEVSVYEKMDKPGGVIQSRQQEGWLTELGPNTLLVRTEAVWRLLEELGLCNEVLEANSRASRRYILKDGKPMPLPSSLTTFIKTDLFSAKAKFRLLKEPFIAADSNPEQNVADFVRRRLGEEILDYAVNPFVAGIFAGDPEHLSLKHTFSKLHNLEQEHGSLFRGMLKQKKSSSARKALISFQKGLQVLPRAICKKLKEKVHLKSEVTQLMPAKGKWQLHFSDGNSARHDAVVSTLPLPVLQKIVADENLDQFLRPLGAITYAPMSIIHLGYHKDQIGHPLDGFGMLVPEKEEEKLLGTLFSSTLFPGRAPENHALLTSFIGGARNPDLASRPAPELTETVRQALGRLLGVKGEPAFATQIFWPQAIPQYETTYSRKLQTMKTVEERFPGLHLAGAYRGGVSVPDCIVNGLEKAREIASNPVR